MGWLFSLAMVGICGVIIFKNHSTFVFEARVTDREGRVNGSHVLLLAISLPESLFTVVIRKKIKDTLVLFGHYVPQKSEHFRYLQGNGKAQEEYRTPVMYFTTENGFGFLFVLGCDLTVFKAMLSPILRFKIVSTKVN